MSKTELGCQVLQEKGHFTEFALFIRQHSHENEDTDLIMKLKSILWAVVRHLHVLLIYVFSIYPLTDRAMLEQLKEDFLSLKRKISSQPCWKLRRDQPSPLCAGECITSFVIFSNLCIR